MCCTNTWVYNEVGKCICVSVGIYIYARVGNNSVSNQRHHQKQCVCVRGVLTVRDAGYFNL